MRTAVLVDGDQQVSPALPEILRVLEAGGKVVERRVYGAGLAPWKAYFEAMGFAVSRLPPPVDSALMVDAIDLAHERPGIGHFCIASADGDFAPLVAKLRERGKRVTGIARGPASSALRTVCNAFLSLDEFPKTALSASAVPQIVQAMSGLARDAGWVEHSLLASVLHGNGFDAHAFGKTSLLDIMEALPDVFEVRPAPRLPGPILVRRSAKGEGGVGTGDGSSVAGRPPARKRRTATSR